jgi:hypothetical protein
MKAIIANLGLGTLGLKIGGGLIALIAPFLFPKVRKAVVDGFGKLLGKGISSAMVINIQDEYVAGRLQLMIRLGIDIAEHEMPTALGEEKKAWLIERMKGLNVPGVLQGFVPQLIDALCARANTELENGNSPAIDAIIAEAVKAVSAQTMIIPTAPDLKK